MICLIILNLIHISHAYLEHNYFLNLINPFKMFTKLRLKCKIYFYIIINNYKNFFVNQFEIYLQNN